MVLGWLGVRTEALTQKQIPYIISGGIGGLLLVAIGRHAVARRRPPRRVAQARRDRAGGHGPARALVNDPAGLGAVDAGPSPGRRRVRPGGRAPRGRRLVAARQGGLAAGPGAVVEPRRRRPARRHRRERVPVPAGPPGGRAPPARAAPRRRRPGPSRSTRALLTTRWCGCRAQARVHRRGLPDGRGQAGEAHHGRPRPVQGPPPLRDLRMIQDLLPFVISGIVAGSLYGLAAHRPRPHVPDERGVQLQPRGDRRRRGLPLLRAAGPGGRPGLGRARSSRSGSRRPASACCSRCSRPGWRACRPPSVWWPRWECSS